MSKRIANTLYLVGFLSLMMGGFQNCAEQPMIDEDGQLISRDGDLSTVQIVDQWSQNKLKFVESSITVENSDRDVKLHGFCHRTLADGESFEWDLVDSSGEDILVTGSSLCSGGGFQVDLHNLNDLSCDEPYEIHVQSEDGEADVMYLLKTCSS